MSGCDECAWNNSPCTRCSHQTKSIDRADMLFACLAEDIKAARASRRVSMGMTVTETGPLVHATPSMLAYFDRLVKRWQEGDGT